MSKRSSIHGEWSSRFTFILAATGSAVGLGNIWKFPYIAGENGGGAFVLIYLLFICLIGVPIMMAELMIGRRGRQSPINSLCTLSAQEHTVSAWRLAGAIGIIAGLIIISFYSVIAGWAIAYLVRTASGVFVGVTADGAGNIFARLVTDPERMLGWHTIFMVMTAIVVARGVRSGLEQAVKAMMPLLFLLLIFLVGYAATTGAFVTGARFLFMPDFSAITTSGVLMAMGHAFFTLSLGVGAMMVYGSYLPKGVSIARTSILISLIDTWIALFAGLAIFPIVFANELAPAAGPGLIFQTLPIAFGHMPAGTLVGTLFFLLLILAAWTSSISLIEPMVAWLVENRGVRRTYAAGWVGLFAWLLGFASVFSFNRWSFEFTFAGKVKSNGMFDVLDTLASGFLLPMGGLAVALFAGWVMSKRSVTDELGSAGFGVKLWYLCIRFLAPVAVIVIFLRAIGVF